jgi:hypothetical protein
LSKRATQVIERPSKRDNHGERRATVKVLRSILSALEITDLIALMMVFATVLSAYATWKTQQVTKQILLIAQRPYIGTESMNLIDDKNPRVLIDLRNFGTVQAEDTVVSIVVRINGKVLLRDSEPQQPGAPVVFSPGVPHRFFRHMTSEMYRDAVQGKITLVVEIQVRYGGPQGDRHCYLTRDSYDNLDNVFYPQRGSLSCDDQGSSAGAD